MADLSFKAQIELIDKMTAPMRSLSSQANRLGKQIGQTSKEAKKLQNQQRLIDTFKKVKSDLGETGKELEVSQQKLNKLNAELKATAHPTQTLIKRFETAQRVTKDLGQRFKSQEENLNSLRGDLKGAGIATNNLAEHQRELSRQIESTNHKLADQRERMKRMRELKAQAQQMGDMRNKAAGVAMGGAAATYAGIRVIQPGVEFEQGMSKVQALTRLDKNSEQYKALEAQARKLGATTQFTQSDAAAGQSFLAMAGFTPENIQKAMPGMLDLALAGGMELDRTADIASNILTGLKMDTGEMGKLADVLSATTTNANVNMEMLGNTLKYAAPSASGLGVSLEEVAAMAGKLGDAGIQGSMGGTALRAIMSRLASPPRAAAKAIDALNLSTTDAQGNLRKMPDILADAWAATENMGNAQRLGYFKAIAGEEAGNAFQVLASQAAEGGLQTFISELKQADGAASQLAKTMTDNTTGDYKAMQSATDALRTSFFDANRSGIRGFMQGLTALIQKLTMFANANPAVIAIIGKLFAFLALGAVVFGTLGAAMLTVLGPLALLRASLITLGLPTSLTPIGGLITGLTKFKTLLMGFKLAALFNPMGLAIMAIAALAIVLIKYWKPVKAFFIGMWQGFKMGIEPVEGSISSITGTFGKLIDKVGLLIKPFDVADITIAKSITTGQEFGYWLAQLTPKIIAIVATLAGLKAGIAVFGGIVSIGTKVATAFSAAMPYLKMFSSGVLQSIGIIVKGFGFVANGLRMLAALAMAHPLLAIMTLVAMAAIYVWRNWDTLGPKFWELVESIKSYFGDLWIKTQEIWARIKTGIINYANQLWAGLGIKFDSGIAGLIAILVAFSPVGLFIRAFVAVWQWFGGLRNKFKGFGVNIIQGLKDGILGKAKAVIDAVTNVANRIKSAFTGARGMDIHSPSRVFDKYGVFTMQGLGGGIIRMAKLPITAVSKVAEKMRATSFSLNTGMINTGLQLANKIPALSNIKRLINNYSPINFDTLSGAGSYTRPANRGMSSDRIMRIVNQPPIHVDTRRSILPAAAHGAGYGSHAPAVTNMGGITINITGATDPQLTAQLVRDEIAKLERNNQARMRSRYSDID